MDGIFRVQGGIWVPEDRMRSVREAFRLFRTKHPKLSELKWTKVGGRRPLTAYVELVDLFHSLVASNHMAFRCIVVNRHEDMSRGLDTYSKDLGFYKTYYILLRWRLLGGCEHHVRLDKRTNPRPQAAEELSRCLNLAAESHMHEPYKVASCIPFDSKDDDLLQVADIMCGAVGWAWNGRLSTSPAKPVIHDRICSGLGWKTLERETPKTDRKFNIWRYRPRKTIAGAPAA